MAWDDAHILNRLRKVIPAASCPGPVADAEIAAAEAALDVRFPLSYRVFLKHFGAAWLRAPYEIAGLGPGSCTDPEPPLWSHVIDVTSEIRRASRGYIPLPYVRISDDGADYAFYLDTAQGDANNECPVVALGPGMDGVIVAPSLLEFVERVATADPIG